MLSLPLENDEKNEERKRALMLSLGWETNSHVRLRPLRDERGRWGRAVKHFFVLVFLLLLLLCRESSSTLETKKKKKCVVFFFFLRSFSLFLLRTAADANSSLSHSFFFLISTGRSASSFFFSCCSFHDGEVRQGPHQRVAELQGSRQVRDMNERATAIKGKKDRGENATAEIATISSSTSTSTSSAVLLFFFSSGVAPSLSLFFFLRCRLMCPASIEEERGERWELVLFYSATTTTREWKKKERASA